MRENMVRTQVYLPRNIYKRLQARADKHGLTLAVQIREALESYVERVEAEADEGILRADDPIFKMVGMFDSGLGDLSVNHDHYLYGAPKREQVTLATSKAAREKPPAAYPRAKTRRGARRKSK